MINYYLLGINIFEFVIMGLDKYFSIRHKYRIAENILLLFSLLGGSIGALLGMFIFRHKTKKIKFKILFPLFLIINVIVYLHTIKVLH